MNNYYQLLQVDNTASAGQIQVAWRRLAKKLHPDTGGDAILFGLVQQAYDTLHDAEKRRAYDKTLQDLASSRASRTRSTEKTYEQTGEKTGYASRASAGQASAGYGWDYGGGRAESSASKAEPAVLIKTLALPRQGIFVLSAPGGETVIKPTEVLRLWSSTLIKLQGVHAQQIARHIVQLELEGQPQHLKRIVPKVLASQNGGFTGAGLLGRTLEKMGSTGNLPSANKFLLECHQLPVNLLITVPTGIAVEVQGLNRALTIGDLNSPLTAKLQKGGQLVVSELCGLDLNMQEAYARIIELRGNAKVYARGQSKLVLNGQIGRLQVDLDQETHAIIQADVHTLTGSVRGGSTLEMQGSIFRVRCSSEPDGFLKLKKVRDFSPPTARTPSTRRGR